MTPSTMISRKMMADLAQDTLRPAQSTARAPDAFMSDWTDVIHRFLYADDGADGTELMPGHQNMV